MATVYAKSSESYLKSTVEPKIDANASASTLIQSYTRIQKAEGTAAHPNGVTEETVLQISPNTEVLNIKSFRVDLTNTTQTGVLRVKELVQGVYVTLVEQATTAGETYLFSVDMITDNNTRLTYQSDIAEGASRDLFYIAGWVGGS